MEEWISACAGKRGGTRDSTAVIGVGEGGGGKENMSLPSKAGRGVYSSLELEQALCLHTLPSGTNALALGKDMMFRMENGSYFDWTYLKDLPGLCCL